MACGCTGLIATPDVACNVPTANPPLPCPNLVPKTPHLQLNTMPPQCGMQDPAATVADPPCHPNAACKTPATTNPPHHPSTSATTWRHAAPICHARPLPPPTPHAALSEHASGFKTLTPLLPQHTSSRLCHCQPAPTPPRHATQGPHATMLTKYIN
ncbi:hypothetical protein H4582DRAFT_2085930 [Lactarius indigo]|nr:hypothetical protein H4582DRAFT_2085930 [Lactarius indigo]